MERGARDGARLAIARFMFGYFMWIWWEFPSPFKGRRAEIPQDFVSQVAIGLVMCSVYLCNGVYGAGPTQKLFGAQWLDWWPLR